VDLLDKDRGLSLKSADLQHICEYQSASHDSVTITRIKLNASFSSSTFLSAFVRSKGRGLGSNFAHLEDTCNDYYSAYHDSRIPHLLPEQKIPQSLNSPAISSTCRWNHSTPLSYFLNQECRKHPHWLLNIVCGDHLEQGSMQYLDSTHLSTQNPMPYSTSHIL
jgi:hypothetical protein